MYKFLKWANKDQKLQILIKYYHRQIFDFFLSFKALNFCPASIKILEVVLE